MIRGLPRLISNLSPSWRSSLTRGFLQKQRFRSCLSAVSVAQFHQAGFSQISPRLRHYPSSNLAHQFSSDARELDDENNALHSETSQNYKLCRRKGIRNVAIIAHVDHGKTTMVDKLLLAARRSHTGETAAEQLSRLMDSGDLEKERGITITSKVTRVDYKTKNGSPVVLNVVDTPGHADFSGEVDRILSMVDGVCLLVDTVEGPMTQTKYVLSRALSAGLKPVVVLNKCDRPEASTFLDSGETETKLNDLFVSLGAKDDQLDYVTCYASARQGWVVLEDPFEALDLSIEGYKGDGSENDKHSVMNLLEAIVDNIPEPRVRCYDIETPEDGKAESFENDKFSMTVVSVGTDNFLGRTCTGRIFSGSVYTGDNVKLLRRQGEDDDIPPQTVTGMFCFRGISRAPLEERAYAGDCVTLAGVPEIVAVGDTITSASNPVDEPLKTPPLKPPTLSMEFGVNTGPLAGKEGSIVAAAKIRDRLFAETDNNVTLKVERSPVDPDKTIVFARGELQLGILIEQMRREGYEMVISPPRILTTKDPETGEEMEPFEEVIIDVDTEYAGTVVSTLTSTRKGILREMNESSADGKTRIIVEVPSRGLLGFSSEIAAATRGSAVVNHVFMENRPHLGVLESSFGKSKLVANSDGKTSAHALNHISSRGTLFVKPGVEVYSGMVVGETTKTGADMEVNAVRTKEATNFRTQVKDDGPRIAPPKEMSLEELIGYMAEDEMLEVTPKSIRLRKAILDPNLREKANRNKGKILKSFKK